MEDTEAARYWCHQCSRVVNPVMEVEAVKCPVCQNGFVEEMGSAAETTTNDNTSSSNPFDYGGSELDGAISLWAPILLGMMNNPRRSRRRFRHLEFEGNGDENRNESNGSGRDGEGMGMGMGEGESERDVESMIRRRRNAVILQLLQGVRAGMLAELQSSGGGGGGGGGGEDDRGESRDGGGERVIFINPFSQTIILQGGYDPNSNNPGPGSHHHAAPSFGDYFMGSGFDMLLQHLAENDPNRYGTPPAQKEVVEALPTVKVEDELQCAVCLEDFEIGAEATEVPCKHRFHSGCILPWLEMHSSCPVCRFQLPADESKREANESRDRRNQIAAESNRTDSGRGEGGGGGSGDARNENGGWFSAPLLWPFNVLFSSQSNNGGDSPQAALPSSNSATNSAPPGSNTLED
ncbi:PREDICTED: E3 ubiquitin-protein ligase RNF126-B-like [Ipomoea nil]|uniref:E3 ubiquitin-protein ligase RNF126-B-like n=1 Tax=Ipomoea nil TaxID=35883 RepID=UPI0009013053|nr:PREDICTED: E3 ubiquitin-protein ligase RNF126-B-like [Ipomoea nil]XP_019155626.1 PREDICTED: E3 ubiquitin-protein ligase RNF126-B-like [Ipomoea nil]XP_019155628.1 PREDICTED: E3 ubiquitin-protein ligase RNF126-B-like [Ipomoea nil]XP_019155629.1 PREDICTED: E3 ubiquitin-protein ligase RNF126-B-like [Ipomoea nil]